MRHFTQLALLFFATFAWSSYHAQISLTYTANGSFPVPEGVTQITVECWGGGGGGGRSTSTSLGRAGGGGGAYARSILTVTPNSSIPFTIGAAGNGATTSGTPSTGNGGNTIFGSNVVVAAGGGGVGNNGNTGGTGGQTTSCVFNDVAYNGGNGSNSNAGNTGAGGGAAGSTGIGAAASGLTQGGATAQLGGAGGAGRNNGGAGNAAPSNATNYGGGGGGARATSVFGFPVNQNGGNGAPGAIRVTYLPPVCSGTPNAGTASINISSGCDIQSFNLTTSGLSSPAIFEGINYQWQSSTNGGGSWQDIPGATNATLTTTAAVNTSYRLRTNCSFSGENNFTNVVSYAVNCWTLPQNTTVTTCGGNFFDSGGSGANYGSNQNYTYTFFPANPGEFVTLTFSQFATQSSTCSQDRDWFRVFNGNSTSANPLHPVVGSCIQGFYTGQNPMPAFPYTITSTAPDGSLTVQFKSDGSTVAAGWAATIGCVPACSGTPNTGTATISAASGCPSTSFTLNATGISTNPGVTYQWQTGPSASGPWVDVVGATAVAYSTTTSVNAHYRLKTTCTNSNISNFSNSITRTVQGSCTCTNYIIYSATDPADTEISSVTVGTMTNNVNTCSSAAAGPGSDAGMYSNFTTTVTGPSVAKGTSVNFSLTQGSCGGNFNNYFQLYVDWNQNGTFETSERMYNQSPATSGTHTKTGNFTVPMSALTGTTRMRIVVIEGSSSSTNYADEDYQYGETEDYCFTVLPPPPSQFSNAWFSMNTGSAQWCPGETRQVSVTVTNTGTLPWTDGGGNDFNVGVKWNFEPDYIVRVDAQNLAVGASQTYFLNMTAPNNPGGTENLTFDVVKEGCFWFSSNGDGCALNTVGPNNTTFVSPQIKIKFDPLNVSAGNTLELCPSTTGQLSGSANSPTITASSIATNPFESSPTELVASPTIASESSCPLNLSVTIPPGAVITGVNITYTMENTQFIPLGTTGQRSYLQCISPGGLKEAALTSGSVAFDALQTYTRNNLTLANGVTGGGTINFRLHGFRTSAGSGCSTTGGHRINQNSVILTVNYTYQPVLEYTWTPALNLSAADIANPMVSPTGNTVYTLSVGAEGCTVESTVSVQLASTGCVQLNTTACGATNVALNQALFAGLVGQPAYRFRITGNNNGNWNNNEVVLDRTVRWFKFAPQVPGAIAGQMYEVEVAIGDGLGNFGPYGVPCNVTLTPDQPTTQLDAAACNATNVVPTTGLFANQVFEAQGYRFRISGANNGGPGWVNDQFILVRTERWFKFAPHVPGFLTGETYDVEVAVLLNDGVTYGPYSTLCEVTLSGTPNLVLDENEISMSDKSLVEVVFGANASHNPFTTEFGLQVLNANDSETINVVIYDMSGKLIERHAVKPMDIENTKFGMNLASGMYMVEVRQGTNQAVIRQVKN